MPESTQIENVISTPALPPKPRVLPKRQLVKKPAGKPDKHVESLRNKAKQVEEALKRAKEAAAKADEERDSLGTAHACHGFSFAILPNIV